MPGVMRLRAVAGFGGEGRENTVTAEAYAAFAPFVRERLAELGVREADLPDLCHEVFLVVHGRAEILLEVDRIDLWLRAVCRRVAAGYRRRAGHRNELLGHDPDQDPAPGGTETDEPEANGYDRGRRLALVRRALNHLDDESRDLLALADVGQMPITTLAKLVDHDRKTVRKRLDSARRRVTKLVCDDPAARRIDANPPARITPPASPLLEAQAARGRETGCTVSELQVLHVSTNRKVGVIGNVAMATWSGQVSVEMVDNVFQIAPRTIELCGGEFVYMALIEPDVAPPSLAARQRIVDALEMAGPYLGAFALVLLGGASAISEPIVSGMMLLARPRFPIRSFSGIDAAANWLCESYARRPQGPLAVSDLVAAAERLRALR
jgi:RNA polymerase sigma-70 factor, ECF subfamily